jgi:excisionase family DNA binding protein
MRAEVPLEPIAVTLPVAASLLGCTVRALRELIWAGKIRYAKLGKRYVVDPVELRAFRQKQLDVF